VVWQIGLFWNWSEDPIAFDLEASQYQDIIWVRQALQIKYLNNIIEQDHRFIGFI
jgi:hypothetical protein